ncbi:hypothetical protein HK097_007459 [Rhizophlyctis rosea]|uniref:Uncharacterized protein n=1 Tax=Rhizophlyctis rosea TaxID=64517 RepID=A0AAD5X1L2_9FUNG|nr:hypothetical protein HK097_007459 [Rhizophlyctis rosea]
MARVLAETEPKKQLPAFSENDETGPDSCDGGDAVGDALRIGEEGDLSDDQEDGGAADEARLHDEPKTSERIASSIIGTAATISSITTLIHSASTKHEYPILYFR